MYTEPYTLAKPENFVAYTEYSWVNSSQPTVVIKAPGRVSKNRLRFPGRNMYTRQKKPVSTVSNTYAHEILTEYYSSGLHHILRQTEAEGRLTGIVNGIEFSYADQATVDLGDGTSINLWQQNMIGVIVEAEVGFRADTSCFNLLTD